MDWFFFPGAAPLPDYLRKPPQDIVLLETSAGRIKVRLFTDKAVPRSTL